MSRRTTRLLRAALTAMYYSGADGLVAPFTRGAGVIFMLHRVSAEPPRAFEPNRILKVTPEFVEQVIIHVIETGFDIVALDEVPARLAAAGSSRPFACFTFDDGYRDNLEVALPVFRRYGVPFTVYVPADYADGRGDLWWLMLEQVVAASAPRLTVEIAGTRSVFATGTEAEKEAAFDEIYWQLRRRPEREARAVVAALADGCGFSRDRLCRETIMGWDELRELARDPLVTIGAHTLGHLALARLDEAEARREIAGSIARVEAEIGRPCRHFSYPYGCASSAGPREFALARELGVATAVTTRKGLLQPSHAEQLTALPRLSLNGDFQDLRFLKVMLSGMPFALWNALTREADTDQRG